MSIADNNNDDDIMAECNDYNPESLIQLGTPRTNESKTAPKPASAAHPQPIANVPKPSSRPTLGVRTAPQTLSPPSHASSPPSPRNGNAPAAFPSMTRNPIASSIKTLTSEVGDKSTAPRPSPGGFGLATQKQKALTQSGIAMAANGGLTYTAKTKTSAASSTTRKSYSSLTADEKFQIRTGENLALEEENDRRDGEHDARLLAERGVPMTKHGYKLDSFVKPDLELDGETDESSSYEEDEEESSDGYPVDPDDRGRRRNRNSPKYKSTDSEDIHVDDAKHLEVVSSELIGGPDNFVVLLRHPLVHFLNIVLRQENVDPVIFSFRQRLVRSHDNILAFITAFTEKRGLITPASTSNGACPFPSLEKISRAFQAIVTDLLVDLNDYNPRTKLLKAIEGHSYSSFAYLSAQALGVSFSQGLAPAVLALRRIKPPLRTTDADYADTHPWRNPTLADDEILQKLSEPVFRNILLLLFDTKSDAVVLKPVLPETNDKQPKSKEIKKKSKHGEEDDEEEDSEDEEDSDDGDGASDEQQDAKKVALRKIKARKEKIQMRRSATEKKEVEKKKKNDTKKNEAKSTKEAIEISEDDAEDQPQPPNPAPTSRRLRKQETTESDEVDIPSDEEYLKKKRAVEKAKDDHAAAVVPKKRPRITDTDPETPNILDSTLPPTKRQKKIDVEIAPEDKQHENDDEEGAADDVEDEGDSERESDFFLDHHETQSNQD